MDANTKDLINLVNAKINEMDALYHAAAKEAGISDGEIGIWDILLHSEESYSQQDLCSKLFLPKQTVNSIVNNLVRKGYVALEHASGTRNRKVICLTEAGMEYGRECVMRIFDAEERAMEGTDPQEVQAAISMLEKYISRLRKEIIK